MDPFNYILILPFYPQILEFWLRNSYNETIHSLTKIFSLSAIFSCASHVLITKFEASKTLRHNLKIEFLFMPIFLIALFFLTSKNFTLVQISLLILFKELILFFMRMYLLRSEIDNIKNYYLYSLFFLLMLCSSFYHQNLYYISNYFNFKFFRK